MSDGFKLNYTVADNTIENVNTKMNDLLQEVEEISKIINTSEQDWQGTTKDAYVNKLTETKKELSEFIDTTFTEYKNKEKARLSTHADNEGANAGTADTLDESR